MKSIGMTLREQCRASGANVALQTFREALKTGRVKPDEIRYGGIAAGILGENMGELLDRYSGMARSFGGRDPVEFGVREQSIVDTSLFSNVIGQILMDRFQQKYDLCTQIGKLIFSTENVGDNLGTYVEQRVTRVRDRAQRVLQGMPYPATTFGQHYVTYPAPEKFGEECNVTIEMVISDKTRRINEMCDSAAEMTGWYEEEDKLSVASGITNPYSENGTAFNTYRTAGNVVNRLTAFNLVDPASVTALEQVLQGQVDPATGLPIKNGIVDMIVMPVRKIKARQILGATEYRSGGTNANDVIISGNPLDINPRLFADTRRLRELLISNGGYTAAQADTMTIAGDFRKAFVWREVYPTRAVQLPPGSEREFSRDIVLSVAGKGYGKACVIDPRYVVQAFTN